MIDTFYRFHYDNELKTIIDEAYLVHVQACAVTGETPKGSLQFRHAEATKRLNALSQVERDKLDEWRQERANWENGEDEDEVFDAEKLTAGMDAGAKERVKKLRELHR